MGEEGEREGLLWGDDQSWAFPKLETGDEDGGIKSEAGKAKGKKRSAVAAGESEDHEVHIWTERERRKKMRNMFSNLHALLPHIPPKADKSTIVDEGVKYIKKLEQSVEELEKRKRNNGEWVQQGPKPVVHLRPEYPAIFQTWASPNVILSVCGRDAQISVCGMRRPGLLSGVCSLIENNNLEVVSAQASSDRATSIYIIHARVNGGSDQFQQAMAMAMAFPIEEIFRQAAAELMMWLNS